MYCLNRGEISNMFLNDGKQSQQFNKILYEEVLEEFILKSEDCGEAKCLLSNGQYDNEITKNRLINKVCENSYNAFEVLKLTDKESWCVRIHLEISETQRKQLINTCTKYGQFRAYDAFVLYYDELNFKQKQRCVETIKKQKQLCTSFLSNSSNYLNVGFNYLKDIIECIFEGKHNFDLVDNFIQFSFSAMEGFDEAHALHEKKYLLELRKRGIKYILQQPKDVINKYLGFHHVYLFDDEKQMFYDNFVKDYLMTLKRGFYDFAFLMTIFSKQVENKFLDILTEKLMKGKYQNYINQYLDCIPFNDEQKEKLNSIILAKRLCN